MFTASAHAEKQKHYMYLSFPSFREVLRGSRFVKHLELSRWTVLEKENDVCGYLTVHGTNMVSSFSHLLSVQSGIQKGMRLPGPILGRVLACL